MISRRFMRVGLPPALSAILVSLVAASAVAMSAGSIQGQFGWSGGTIAISGSVAQTVDQSGTKSRTGIGAWQISNNTSAGSHNGAFSGWPFSPGLAVAAGQPSSAAGADLFTATLYFKAGGAAADGSNIEIDLGTTAGDDRNTFLAVTNRADADGGLQLRASEPDGVTGGFLATQIIATGISRTAWHKLDIVARFYDGDGNDTFEVSLDGTTLTNPLTAGTTFGTFEGYRNGNSFPYALSNRLFFRSGAAPSAFGAFADASSAGIFIDDLVYTVADLAAPASPLAGYATGFEPTDACTTVCYADTIFGNDANGGASAADAKKTIQAAITAVDENGTVIVAAGTYVENLSIAKGLRLEGVDPGVAAADPADLLTPGWLTTVLQSATVAGPAIDVTGDFDMLEIANLRAIGVDGTGGGTMRLGLGAISSDLLLDTVAFDGGMRGIFTVGGFPVDGVTIRDSAFRTAVAIASTLELWFAASDLSVIDNYVTGGRDGMNLGNGLGADLPLPVAGISLVDGNEVDGYGDSGIQVAVSFADLTLSNNVVRGPATGTSGEGIQIESSAQATKVRVTANTIDDGDDGLVFSGLTASSVDFVASRNIITDQTGAGVIARSGTAANIDALVIERNAITGNTPGASNGVALSTLNAECNWWGSATGPGPVGPGSGDGVSAGVDFDLWLVTSDLDGPCAIAAVDTAGGDAIGTEGGTLSSNGAFTGTGVTITADNAIGTFVDNLDGTWTWSYATTDDVASQTITVTATDAYGGTAPDAFQVSAANADPIVAVPTTSGSGGISVTAAFTDAGTSDTHTCTVDWGDASSGPGVVTEASGSGSCAAGPHAYGGPGLFTITVTVTDDNLGSDANSTSVTIAPDGAKAIKAGVLAEIEAAHPTGNRTNDKNLKKAIDALKDSLAPGLWVDADHLKPKQGILVFYQERKAVQELQKIRNPGALADDIESWIDSLVAADRALAKTVIDEAPAGKRKALALLEFAKGNAFAAHGKPDRAIEFYGLAWLVLKG